MRESENKQLLDDIQVDKEEDMLLQPLVEDLLLVDKI